VSIRQLQARLERLERAVSERKVQGRIVTFEFPIDPELAKAIWNDVKRLFVLDMMPVSGPGTMPRCVARILDEASDTPEEIALRERIAERAKTIPCPPCYGLREFLDDTKTLPALVRGKDDLLPGQHDFFIDNLEDVDAEKAQVAARMEAFKQTPEGQARFRLKELLDKSELEKPGRTRRD
jgi:hypothetical protein